MRRIIISVYVLFIGLISLFTDNVSASQNYYRIAGTDRIDTSIEISKMGWESADYIILARADNPVDALASSSLSGKFDAPILLTYPSQIPNTVIKEIERLNAKNVFILGGIQSVSYNIESQLSKLGLNIKRINGKDRFETAFNMNLQSEVYKGTKAIIINGYVTADALSASSPAAIQQIPIYLAMKDSLPYELPKNITEVQIYGGESVVSNEVAEKLKNTGIKVVRIAGQDRYQTNLQSIDSSKFENIIFVRGTSINMYKEDYPDAVAAAGLAHKLNANIVLIDPKNPMIDINFFINNHTFLNIFVLGGPATISDNMIENILTNYPDTSAEILFDSSIDQMLIHPENQIIYIMDKTYYTISEINYVTGEIREIKVVSRILCNPVRDIRQNFLY